MRTEYKYLFVELDNKKYIVTNNKGNLDKLNKFDIKNISFFFFIN